MNKGCQPWMGVLKELKKSKRTINRFDHPGLYAIYIQGQLVYIGKSKDMICRLAQHIFYTNNLNYTKSHKYEIISEARKLGYDIQFEPIYYPLTWGDLDDELGFKEGELIRQYLPPLNYQIPKEEDYHKFTINKKASTITLQEILGKDGK